MALPDIHQICLDYCKHEAAQTSGLSQPLCLGVGTKEVRTGSRMRGRDGDREEDKCIDRIKRKGNGSL